MTYPSGPVVFVDIVCPEPYDFDALDNRPLGGTEATVMRVVRSLRPSLPCVVVQHNRESALDPFLPLDSLASLKEVSAVICLRSPVALPYLRSQFPDSRLFLWCHDLNLDELVMNAPVLSETRTTIVAVSRWHKQQIASALLSQSKDLKNIKVDYIHNPVVDLIQDETTVLKRKFIYFSSPHKGLDLTLAQWKHIHRALPMSTLFIANPGYLDHEPITQAGVQVLGKLSHQKVIQHVRESQAALHFNYSFPETFGLVHAEASAVGTPVLTSHLGANREVLSGCPQQIIDVRDTKVIIERLEKWESERPQVSLNPEFKIESVISRWMEVLK